MNEDTVAGDLGAGPETAVFKGPAKRKQKGKGKSFKKIAIEQQTDTFLKEQGLSESEIEELYEESERLEEKFRDFLSKLWYSECKKGDDKCLKQLEQAVSGRLGDVAQGFFDEINSIAKRFSISATTIYKQMMFMMGNTSTTAKEVEQFLDS